MITSFAIASLLFAVPPFTAPATTQPRAAVAQAVRDTQLTHCLVSLIEDVQVPAREAGALVSVAVQEGAYVKQGQLLAQIDDQQPKLDKLAAELSRNAALAKAEDDVEVRYSEAAFAVATAELERALAIERRSPGGVTQQEIQKLQLAKHRDELQIERSKLERHVAKMNADVQQAAGSRPVKASSRSSALTACAWKAS
jgi:multidrug efflux pump subunit AcrA (membrane-fusion protein)